MIAELFASDEGVNRIRSRDGKCKMVKGESCRQLLA